MITNLRYITTVNHSTAAATTTPYFDLADKNTVTLHIQALGAPTGTFTIQGTNHPEQLDPQTVTPTTGTLPTPAGGPASAIVGIANAPRWVRVSWAGTGTGTFAVYVRAV